VFKGLKPIVYNGREVWPLVEGGKGVAATNHASAGAWAAAGGIGTVSAVNADSYDPEGKIIPQVYRALTRRDRHEELIEYAIEGAVQQVKRAFEIAGGKGAININVLWEMGGAQRVLHGVLERTKGMVAGVTCGAGMPYKLSEIAAPTKSATCRSSRRAAPSARCGSAPIPRRRNGWRRWSMRTPGSPVAITACPTPKTRCSRRTRIRASRRCATRCARAAFPTTCRS